ncbi:uncharacterized protein BJ212DRAFT_221669 [Suillus subaureus]|uniref:Uncharacterized protein n=1 Tax=Suillus subaureus TaxID=48587 RepID=A0A9P7E9L1_9AGAM|nr:uncharacterized protein BJ212DRAFT_221669 [Suillus subaureus]KAG1815493.1 hypothetical protein BJ212DRAFT_221669 [Suillus subaureus]
MRRMSSVFLARRADKPDAPSSNDNDPLPQEAAKRKGSLRMFNSLSRKVVPQQLFASGSSSSASSGSAELRTPDDEELPRTRMLGQKGSWKSWLGAKNHRDEGDTKATWLPPLPTAGIALRPPPTPTSNETDDASSESESEADHLQDPPTQSFAQSITQARHSMRVIILNSSADGDRPSCPPLLDIPHNTPFPRSCLRVGHVRCRDTLESKMHKAVLLSTLESLSPSEERSLAPLGSRPVTLVKEAPVHDPDIDRWPKAQFLRSNSEGLGNWVARPCYEDRVLVWTRQEPSGQIVTSSISGSQFGVAALEFSEPLQILAGIDDGFDPSAELQPELSRPPSGAAAVALPSTEKLSPSVAVADFEFSPLTLAVDSPDESKNETSNLKAEPTPAPAVKRGVRFAEDGKDDQIPLGYVLRIKKKREEKARFLREEREKRELEEGRRAQEDRRKREEERRLWEAQMREQEEERQARELHKKKIEEARRKQNYASDLQASRTRREASRAGHISSSTLVRDIERDRSASRDAHPSGVSSTRQRTTDLRVSSASLSPYDGSPASSMPATPGSQHSYSRPPSVYSTRTTSSDDARGRDGRYISKRTSVAFDPSKQLSLPLSNPRASFLPYNPWGNMPVPPFSIPPVSPLPVAPMMAMPFYSLDPLLPPSPPFMMNQFGMTNQFGMQPYPTYSSHGQVPSSPRQNSFSNHSAESVRHTYRAAPNSPVHVSNHQRRASDETRGHSSSSNVTADRKYGSQTDLRDKRSPQAAHPSCSSGLHRSHQPPALVHAHTAPGRSVSTSQTRSTSSRHQSVYP